MIVLFFIFETSGTIFTWHQKLCRLIFLWRGWIFLFLGVRATHFFPFTSPSIWRHWKNTTIECQVGHSESLRPLYHVEELAKSYKKVTIRYSVWSFYFSLNYLTVELSVRCIRIWKLGPMYFLRWFEKSFP